MSDYHDKPKWTNEQFHVAILYGFILGLVAGALAVIWLR